jgi:hypothetical protein
MPAEFHPDHYGVGQMLRSDFMEGTMVIFAQGIMAIAVATAPVGSPAEDDRHPGRYKASFHIRHHSRGGATKDRAEAIVYNDSPEALYVEYGRYGREAHHTLARAAFRRII